MEPLQIDTDSGARLVPRWRIYKQGTRVSIAGPDTATGFTVVPEARVAELEEAIASALTSLATGPMKDGYAYSVLSEVSAKGESAK